LYILDIRDRLCIGCIEVWHFIVDVRLTCVWLQFAYLLAYIH
jgi:hypothetical protein